MSSPSTLPASIPTQEEDVSDTESCSSTSTFIQIPSRLDSEYLTQLAIASGEPAPRYDFGDDDLSDTSDDWSVVEEGESPLGTSSTSPSGAVAQDGAESGDGALAESRGKERDMSEGRASLACDNDPGPDSDEALARSLQEEADAEFARELQEEESMDADYDSDDSDDEMPHRVRDTSEADVEAGPFGLTDDELLRLLPLSEQRRARIGGDSGASIGPMSASAGERRDRTRWHASSHPSAANRSDGFDFPSVIPTPSTSRDVKGPPRIPEGTSGTFNCPLCKEVCAVESNETVTLPCPEKHMYCRGCLHGFVRNELARSVLPLVCTACRAARGLLFVGGSSRRKRDYEIPIYLAKQLRLDSRDIARWQQHLDYFESRLTQEAPPDVLPGPCYMPTRRPASQTTHDA